MNHQSRVKQLKRWFGSRLLHLALRGIGWSGSTLWLGEAHLKRVQQSQAPWIYCFWHCNITQTLWPLRGIGFAGLVSSSDDGEIAAQALHAFGNIPIRGSSSTGGAKALLQLIRWVKKGKIAAITPDGPRGPALYLQMGAVTLASKSGAPLLPLHMESTKQWVFKKSWDTHMIPKPFATKVISLGPPIYIPSQLTKDDAEQWRVTVEKKMLENQQIAQKKIKALLES